MTIDQRLEEIMSEYRFLQILNTPWKELDAYKFGIINENGKILKSIRTLKEVREKQAYPDVFYALCWTIKRLTEQKLTESRNIESLAKCLWELKTKYGGSNPQKYEHHLQDHFAKHNITFFYKPSEKISPEFNQKFVGEVYGILLFKDGNKLISLNELKKMSEDGAVVAPTNNVGGGQIAGVSPGQEPPMPKTLTTIQKRKKLQRRQQDRIKQDIQTINIVKPNS